MSSATEAKIIVVMGPAGSGKTTFTNLVGGTTFPEGVDSLEACTKTVQTAEFVLDGQPILLIDTPGFDAEEGSGASRRIAAFLKIMHKEGRDITGVIYTHRINDNRMSAVAVKNFQTFRNICGDGAMDNVAIVTNMWELIRKEVGEARERELRTANYGYKEAIDQGASILRHDGSVESAKAILREMITKDTVTLQCQESQEMQERREKREQHGSHSRASRPHMPQPTTESPKGCFHGLGRFLRK